MTNHEIEYKIKAPIKNERQITNEILCLINMAEERNIHLQRGFSSLFEWLTKGLGYSGSAAQRRISSARLLKVVPQAAAKLESGEINLTNLAKAQASIKAQQKITGRKMTGAQQAEVVRIIENKTTDDAALALLKLFPDTASTVHQERTKRIDEDPQRLTLNFTNEDMENLAWIRDYLSHAMPEATNGQILARLMREFRKKKSTAATAVNRLKREHRTCEYVDEETGKVCGGTVRVESDHVIPLALGGPDEPWNSRCLCRNHNQFMAEQILGRRWANQWRRGPRARTVV